MPTLCLPSRQKTRSLWDLEEAPYAQGNEAEQLYSSFDKVEEQWLDRELQPDTFMLNKQDASDEDDLPSYRSLPFKPAGTRIVRYTSITPLKPPDIVFDDNDDE